MVEQGKTPLRPAGELYVAGYAIVLVPIAPLLASVHALRRLFEVLRRDGTTEATSDRMAEFAELNAFLGLAERYRRER
jgi:2-methylisocitrate lyase-like PEP mutase family enzyme